MATRRVSARLSTGVTGLDEIMNGGLIPGRAYLVSAGPGCGKTILGLHFLSNGAAAGERTLFITLEEPAGRIRENAGAIGFDLQGIDILDLSPDADFFTQMQTYDLFSPAEVEREPVAEQIIARVDQLEPQRVFLDSMSQFRYLSSDAFQFRKQVLSFLRFMADRRTTVLFSSESTPDTPDDDLRFMSDGIIELSYRDQSRTAAVAKFRGSGFRRGHHALRLGERGMAVYPRLLPAAFGRSFEPECLASGVRELDALLHGGVERGTATIISGPTGTGKTTLGLQFLKEAAGRGERSVVYTFEESVSTIVRRSESINLPVGALLDNGALAIVPVEPLRYAPDEFASLVRGEVEQGNARMVMLDSTAGYALSFRDEDLERHLHALCKYLKNMGVTTILVDETAEILSQEFRATNLGISYLADTILYVRYVEIDGAMRKAIGVLKKRLSDFEKTLCELRITPQGLQVRPDSSTLSGRHGILSGHPDAAPEEAREE